VGILATHGHFDHLLGALDLKLIYQVPFYCSSLDQFLLDRQKETARHFLGRDIKVPNFKKIDIDLDMTKEIILGEEKLEVIKTPGHTPGGVCFYNQKNDWLFSGDTLFAQGVGRTDTSYGNINDLKKSLEIIKKLSPDTEILSGHGEKICLRLIY
jgi:glyoxylase-like metal-dependent hydrolase (beta-lactamase superfamily II)